MPERIPLERGGLGEHYIVTTDDQRLFRCSVRDVGGRGIVASGNYARQVQLRWVFEDTRCTYNGPPFFPLQYLDELQVLVNDWWRTKRELDQTI